ncbi:MAG: hypothetical protein F6K47_32155 [Symploca sp. SIO2E6]|nr:hypothetical protein [Symploca sp. SIO2E6]
MMTPDKHQNQENLRKLKVSATTPEAKLIENPETRFPREEAKAIDKAQQVMNDLYREQAEYGDGSCAFMAMKEQFEGGVGNEPKSLKKNTLHERKCREYIKGLKKHLPHVPPEATQIIQNEIQKIEQALQCAEDSKNDNDPKIPAWAKPWKYQLGK